MAKKIKETIKYCIEKKVMKEDKNKLITVTPLKLTSLILKKEHKRYVQFSRVIIRFLIKIEIFS